MLVLTRKRRQKITINENIVITFLEYGHGQVKIGIDAPANISILRNELISAEGRDKYKEKEKDTDKDKNINLNIKNDLEGNRRYEHDRER